MVNSFGQAPKTCSSAQTEMINIGTPFKRRLRSQRRLEL